MSRWSAVAHAALVVAQFLLLEHAVFHTGLTWDEPKYTFEGARWIATGQVPQNPVPLFAFGAEQAVAGVATPPGSEGWMTGEVPRALRDARLHTARQATVIVAILGGVALAASCGPYALLAHALWVFSPTVLANGALATLDVWVASMSAGVLWATRRAEAGAAWGVGMVGVFGALAGASKVVGFGALLFPALMWWRRPRALVGMALAAAGTTWAAHGFDVGPVTLPGLGEVRLPAPQIAQLLGFQLDHMYVSGNGPPGQPEPSDLTYALKALAWKLCPTTVVLAAVRLRAGRRAGDLALVAWPVALCVLLSVSRTQLGVRYLLPAAPFAIAWLAGAARWPRVAAVLAGVGSLMVAFGAPWLTWCDPLLGDRAAGLRALPHGSDWCQDREAAVDWLAANPGGPVYYSGCVGAPPMGLTYRPPPCTPTPGIYVVHAVDRFVPGSTLETCLSWLPAPTTTIGDTLTLWRVPPE